MRPPVVIFDKSFLEALSLDEAIIFDALYCTNLTPLFFTEVLGDLEKSKKSKEEQERIVSHLAYKSPRCHVYANMNHQLLCLYDLMADPHAVNITSYIPQIRYPLLEGDTGIPKGLVLDIPPELQSCMQWSDGIFSERERDFAREYRESLKRQKRIEEDDRKAVSQLKLSGLKEVLDFAKNGLLGGKIKWYSILKVLFDDLSAPEEFRKLIINRWKKEGGASLSVFSPYTFHTLLVDNFVNLAIASSQISDERASNRIDLAYLYYLPFTEIFISGDKLHERTVPLFLDDEQRYIKSGDMKEDLKKLCAYYSGHPEVHSKGIIGTVYHPPTEGNFLASQLYDQFCTGWRSEALNPINLSKEQEEMVISQLYKEEVIPGENITITRSLPKEWGKWKMF